MTAALPTNQPWTTLIVQNHPHRRTALTTYFSRGGRVTAVADHAAALALTDALHPDLIVLLLPNPGTTDAELTTLLSARYPHTRLAYTCVLGAEPATPCTTGSAIQRPETIATSTTYPPAWPHRGRRAPTRRAPSSA